MELWQLTEYMCMMYRLVNGWCRLSLSHTQTHTGTVGVCVSDIPSVRWSHSAACSLAGTRVSLLCSVSCSNSGFYRVYYWLWGFCRFTEVCREQTVTWQHTHLREMLKYRCNPQHNTPNVRLLLGTHGRDHLSLEGWPAVNMSSNLQKTD